MTTGQRIAQKRKELELSQEALGAELGVSRQSIYKWESDAALPEIDKLVALSRRFGVTVGWLLGVEDAAEPPAGESGELTDMQLKWWRKLWPGTGRPSPCGDGGGLGSSSFCFCLWRVIISLTGWTK